MALVVLLHGQPGNGKSFGSIVLKARDCFDAVLHTDELYTGYVYTRQRKIYADNMRHHIMEHFYDHRGRIEAAWQDYLFGVVSQDAHKVGRLLVEGWQLTFCYQAMAEDLRKRGHTVHHVLVSGQRYFINPPPGMEIEQLAAWVGSQQASPN